jgi:hypothetical protein
MEANFVANQFHPNLLIETNVYGKLSQEGNERLNSYHYDLKSGCIVPQLQMVALSCLDCR